MRRMRRIGGNPPTSPLHMREFEAGGTEKKNGLEEEEEKVDMGGTCPSARSSLFGTISLAGSPHGLSRQPETNVQAAGPRPAPFGD